VLGIIAIGVAIWAPRGLWGLISERLNIRLFPVGYVLWPASGAGGGRDDGPAGGARPPDLHQLIRRLGRRS
jgi:hypothetical protein